MAARKNKIKHEEKTKDEIRGTQLVRMLTQVGLSGKYNGFEVSSDRIAAAKAALPFLRPTFSAVEQTIVDNRDLETEEQILAKLKGLVESYPDLIRSLLDKAKPAEQVTYDPSSVSSALLDKPTVQ